MMTRWSCAVICLLAVVGCRRESKYPEQLRVEMTFKDFMRIEETNGQAELLFDGNRDGWPDSWIVWQRYPEWKELGARVDKNFDGKPDAWMHYDGELYAEFDKDFDGRIDTWVYKSGVRKVDTDGDGKPDKEEDTHTTKPRTVP